MQVIRKMRWLLFALLLSLVPASSYAGVFISVGFAPPILPVYVQPPCPEPNLIWMPGYWAYGEDGYYWVPGAWVPAPYEGALWTPGYWGWSGGLYVFHDGYWGPHVGYYGGVNYGFGYMGVGFVGGEWRGHSFAYNTAVVHVNETIVHTTYVNETIVHQNTIINDRHVAFSGGPGGIVHPPSAQEQMAMHESHIAPTSFQQQHMQTARADRTSYFKANNGHPQNVVASRPLAMENHPAPAGGLRPGAVNNSNNRPGTAMQPGNANRTTEYRPGVQNNTANRPGYQNNSVNRPTPQNNTYNRPETPNTYNRPAAPNNTVNRPQTESRPEYRPSQPPTTMNRPQNESHPNTQPHPENHPQSRPQKDQKEPRR